MKQLADSKRRDLEFQISDLVVLKLHCQCTIFKRAYHKLASRYYRPYPIAEKISCHTTTWFLHPPHIPCILIEVKTGWDHRSISRAAFTMCWPRHPVELKAILDYKWVKHGSKFVEQLSQKLKSQSSYQLSQNTTYHMQEFFPKTMPPNSQSHDYPHYTHIYGLFTLIYTTIMNSILNWIHLANN